VEDRLKIDTEPFSQALFDELLPLAYKCWQESTDQKAETCAFYGERDFKIEPDFDAYQRLSDVGALAVVTLRDEARLVGYVVGFTYRALHHKHILGGIGDTVYIEPDYRTYAPILAARFEKEMKDRGVGIIGWPTHPNSPVYALLQVMGYVGDDIVMEKRIKD
jgi:predicted GNAT superfamily acetyltransferase